MQNNLVLSYVLSYYRYVRSSLCVSPIDNSYTQTLKRFLSAWNKSCLEESFFDTAFQWKKQNIFDATELTLERHSSLY